MSPNDHPLPAGQPAARVYIVRLWPERYDTHQTPEGPEPVYVWRASVLRDGTGQRRAFPSLEACLQHLQDDWLPDHRTEP